MKISSNKPTREETRTPQAAYFERLKYIKELQGINLAHLLSGSLVRMRKTCGKSYCQCAKGGPGHPALYLQLDKKLYFLPAPRHKRAIRYHHHYLKVKELLKKITLCNLELLKQPKRENVKSSI